MKQGSFKISTDQGVRLVHGYIGDFIGIDQRQKGEGYTATMLHTGTKCDSLFEAQLRVLRVINSPENLSKLIEAVDRLERQCEFHFYALLDLPWGATEYSPHHEAPIAAIREAKA
jgi:hypothetical protein